MPTARLADTASPSVQMVCRTPQALAGVPVRGASRRRHRGRGRPTLLNDAKKERLLVAVRAGNRVPAAARYAGVSPKSVNEWIRRGEGRDGRPAIEPYVSFAREVDQAMAHAELQAVATIRRAMPRSPRWAAWWLERTIPEWRLSKDRGGAAQPATPPMSHDFGHILIDGETLRRLSSEQVRAQLGVADVDDATLARRARLVSSED